MILRPRTSLVRAGTLASSPRWRTRVRVFRAGNQSFQGVVAEFPGGAKLPLPTELRPGRDLGFVPPSAATRARFPGAELILSKVCGGILGRRQVRGTVGHTPASECGRPSRGPGGRRSAPVSDGPRRRGDPRECRAFDGRLDRRPPGCSTRGSLAMTAQARRSTASGFTGDDIVRLPRSSCSRTRASRAARRRAGESGARAGHFASKLWIPAPALAKAGVRGDDSF